MGSGQSKSDDNLPNGNNNISSFPVKNDTTRAKPDKRCEQKSNPAETTTTSPEIRSTGFQSSNFRNKNDIEFNQFRSTDAISKAAEIKREQKINPTPVKHNDFNDDFNSNDENSDSWLNIDIDKEKRQRKTKIKERQKVNIKKVDQGNLIEFLDSSDESDTDSILGRGDSKRSKHKKMTRTNINSGSAAKAISLPLPAPASHPNHSKVFEQEKALNEYNLQHGYNLLPSPQKKLEQSHNISLHNVETSQKEYPESYAQRLQRDNYRRDQAAIVREKTIHRNTDDWDLEESIVKNFDAERFKAANVKKIEHDTQGNYNKEDGLYEPSPGRERKKSRGNPITPQYDDLEEDLMDAIERDFD